MRIVPQKGHGLVWEGRRRHWQVAGSRVYRCSVSIWAALNEPGHYQGVKRVYRTLPDLFRIKRCPGSEDVSFLLANSSDDAKFFHGLLAVFRFFGCPHCIFNTVTIKKLVTASLETKPPNLPGCSWQDGGLSFSSSYRACTAQ